MFPLPVYTKRGGLSRAASQRRDILLAARAIQEKEARNTGGVFGRFRAQRPADWITPGQQRDILLLAQVIQERDPAGKEAAG